ncbi:MAG TPA: 3-isopropylmalate dehydrogenase [Planctomycetaceae bacterium]|nr:3-isopropylmalate dehydrogenase [Planctomycetaceae bacterium]
MPRTFDVAVIEGDGIGPEVTREAIRAVEAAESSSDAAFQWTRYPWGTEYYLAQGRMAPPDFLDLLARHNAILLGAVGHPQVQDHVTLNGLLLPIRRRFDQCVCLRPAFLYPGVQSPLRDKPPGSIDLLVFRENTEGEYANVGGRLYQGSAEEVAIQTSVFTRRGCDRIIRAAFEKARARPRRRVASITKSNAQGYGMVLWDETFTSVAGEFPEIATESLLIDRAVMEFVRRPESFDVVVASNLFGDILTDLAAIIVGSMGLAASANLDPTRRSPSMFEPVHGSAPDIAGKGIANPLAAILSAGMMLEHLRLETAANAVKNAVANLLAGGGPRSPDLGGTATTTEVGDAVVERIRHVS